ncbi:NAD(P)/FAD-dependent oxidoreductase [Phytohabitans houttuyneae]|uniref:Ferredoxin n=1 Tax=Phytohabitans houttuyneae TaxID=1076126 RepID=A0A6V8KSM4_9ACTN|nr:FAD-dependent oxidoreductase [Phytohabitans houttuyneae]GFJ85351.1 ferredoxin [Phytohabitans houttuyneae]
MYLIIGASLSGAKAAQTLREEGYTGRLVLVGEETHRPYERPPLSKGFLAGKEPEEKAFVHDAGWYAEHDVELLLGRRATHLDVAAHTVTLDGVDELRYDKLLLATGSRVRTLDVAGADAHGIRYLRTMDEAEALLDGLRAGGNVVVIGAGWIGLEVAAAAREHGCTVDVIEMAPLPLHNVLGHEVAAIFRDLHEAHGVRFHFEAGVREIGAVSGRVSNVVLEDNTEVAADLVLVGVGIRPATELAETAGLTVDDGVVTDASLRTADPDVFACGDVARFHSPLVGDRIRVEHWSNALNGGPAAARSMLGQAVEYDRVPYFFTDQYDLGMEYAGWVPPRGYDRVVFRGDPSIVDGKTPEFVVFWTKGGRVLAGMNVNVWDVQDQIQALVRAGYAGTAVDLDRLADPSVPLDSLVG